jgi:hypothetical protein
MRSELFNLYLFGYAIAKTSLLTGLAPGILLAIAMEFPYVYRWAKYLGMPLLSGERKGQLCKVLVWAKKNSCLVEFPDGFRAVTSRAALRKARS